MLLLCSNGLSSEKLLTQLRVHTGGCATAALVVTADPEYKKRNYHVPRCIQELEKLNLKIDILDLDENDPAILMNYDVVEFIGGNPFYLLDAIRKSGAAEILHTIAADKILIGWSAAAFVFGPSLELVNRYSPEMNFVGLQDLTALGLTKTEILPHYDRFLTKFPGFEETCNAYETAHQTTVLRLKDGEGIFLDTTNQHRTKGSPCEGSCQRS